LNIIGTSFGAWYFGTRDFFFLLLSSSSDDSTSSISGLGRIEVPRFLKEGDGLIEIKDYPAKLFDFPF
jgi:hypothetical protein